jgi:ankyrin repeat protein
VFCQLDALQHCFPTNLRQFLNELPETLDETYEHILRGINKAQKDNAHRLLQCLTVASRPLRVEELAELLAFDFQASRLGGIPTLKDDWRWDDEEEAVLSTCSSLIAIVPNGDSRVVQFSHFSVKEYLTSPRLARSPDGDVSRFNIKLELAHTIMAQACLATLLRSDEHAGNNDIETSPLVGYAAEHWVDHPQFGHVSSRVRDGMDELFETSKPHFAAWLRVHNIDQQLSVFRLTGGVGSPLYYVAFCGFHDLAERLIMKHPEQVNARGGLNVSPLSAALFKRRFRIANLLYGHGASVDVRDSDDYTPLTTASVSGEVDIMRWLLDHGADANARTWVGRTALHYAVHTHLDAVQVLLEHSADVNLQDDTGDTPLYESLDSGSSLEGKTVDIGRQLLEHGANPNIPNLRNFTPLHRASSRGLLEVSRLLLSYGAKVDVKDEEGRTPFQLAGCNEIAKLLLAYDAVP